MQAWEQFVRSQEAELGVATVEKWLKPLKVLRFDACNLYIEAKDSFQALWFEEHMRSKVQQGLVNNNNKRIKLHLSIANAPVKTTKKREAKEGSESSRPTFSLTFDEADPHCSFVNFVPSQENLFTYKLFSEFSSGNGEGITPNPIYLHGASGAGKTHLLMATVAALRARGVNVLYSRAQTFTDHVVSAIRAGEMSFFRQMYRSNDVLVVDDVHVFSRKGATQEEFFHTFNTLHMAGKQIILSANCAPGELQLIEPRLVSRFEWGVVLSLEMPGKSDVLKILKSKTMSMKVALHPKVEEFLIETFPSLNSLMKALKALVLRSHLNSSKPFGGQVTVLWVQQHLADLIAEEKKAMLTPERLVQGVSEYFGVRTEDVFGKVQTRDYVLPRQLAMYLCRQQLKLPYLRIAELFAKDHSTVMTSVKRIQKAIDADDMEIGMAYRTVLKKIDRSNCPDK